MPNIADGASSESDICRRIADEVEHVLIAESARLAASGTMRAVEQGIGVARAMRSVLAAIDPENHGRSRWRRPVRLGARHASRYCIGRYGQKKGTLVDDRVGAVRQQRIRMIYKTGDTIFDLEADGVSIETMTRLARAEFDWLNRKDPRLGASGHHRDPGFGGYAPDETVQFPVARH